MVFQVTNFKFELLVSIINCFSMLFHGTLFEKVYTKPWMACFHHELFQHVVSWDSFEINIWIAYFFHKLMQHPFENNCMYKFHIWIFTYFQNNKKVWKQKDKLRNLMSWRILEMCLCIKDCGNYSWDFLSRLTLKTRDATNFSS